LGITRAPVSVVQLPGYYYANIYLISKQTNKKPHCSYPGSDLVLEGEVSPPQIVPLDVRP